MNVIIARIIIIINYILLFSYAECLVSKYLVTTLRTWHSVLTRNKKIKPLQEDDQKQETDECRFQNSLTLCQFLLCFCKHAGSWSLGDTCQ